MEDYKQKVTITLSKEVVVKIDNYAKVMGVTRSAAISFLTMKAIQEDNSYDLSSDYVEGKKGKTPAKGKLISEGQLINGGRIRSGKYIEQKGKTPAKRKLIPKGQLIKGIRIRSGKYIEQKGKTPAKGKLIPNE